MREYLELWTTFFRIGIMTFGGGYAMLPMIQREIVEKKKWADEEEILNYYAIGQCTPGVIAVNLSTFIGNKIKGIPGGFLATFGVIAPSLIIISVIAALLNNFADIPVVQHALSGVRVAVVVLVIFSVVKLFKAAVKDTFGWIMFLGVFTLVAFLHFSAVYMVLAAAALGVAVKLIMARKSG